MLECIGLHFVLPQVWFSPTHASLMTWGFKHLWSRAEGDNMILGPDSVEWLEPLLGYQVQPFVLMQIADRGAWDQW